MLNPASINTGADADAKTDARRNFFIQCSWDIEKIAAISLATHKRTVYQELAKLCQAGPKVAPGWPVGSPCLPCGDVGIIETQEPSDKRRIGHS
jgi:hypothetical protein